MLFCIERIAKNKTKSHIMSIPMSTNFCIHNNKMYQHICTLPKEQMGKNGWVEV